MPPGSTNANKIICVGTALVLNVGKYMLTLNQPVKVSAKNIVPTKKKDKLIMSFLFRSYVECISNGTLSCKPVSNYITLLKNESIISRVIKEFGCVHAYNLRIYLDWTPTPFYLKNVPNQFPLWLITWSWYMQNCFAHPVSEKWLHIIGQRKKSQVSGLRARCHRAARRHF